MKLPEGLGVKARIYPGDHNRGDKIVNFKQIRINPAFIILGILVLVWIGLILGKGFYPEYQMDDNDFQRDILRVTSAIDTGSLYRFIWVDNYNTPLSYQVSGIIFKLCGWRIEPPLPTDLNFLAYNLHILQLSQLSHLPFLILLLLGLYGIGKLLFGPLTGWMGMVYYIGLPVVIILATRYTQTFPATGPLAVAFYCLLASDNFRHKKYAWGFGIFWGLTLLTDWLPGYLMLGSVGAYAVWLFLKYFKNWRMRLISMLWLTAVPFFLYHISCGLFRHETPQKAWFFFWASPLCGLIFYFLSRLIFTIGEQKGFTRESEKIPWDNLFTACLITYCLTGWLYLASSPSSFNHTLYPQNFLVLIPPSYAWLQSFYHLLFLSASPLQLMFLGAGLVYTFLSLKNRPILKIYLINLALALLMFLMLQRQTLFYYLPLMMLMAPLATGWIEPLKNFWKALPIALLFLFGVLNILNPIVYGAEPLYRATPAWIRSAFYPPPQNITVHLGGGLNPNDDGFGTRHKDLNQITPFCLNLQENADIAKISKLLSYVFPNCPADFLDNFLTPLKNQQGQLLFYLPANNPLRKIIPLPGFSFVEQPNMTDFGYLFYLRDLDSPENQVNHDLIVNARFSSTDRVRLILTSRQSLPDLGQELMLYKIESDR